MKENTNYVVVEELSNHMRDVLYDRVEKYNEQLREIGLDWLAANPHMYVEHLMEQREERYLLRLGNYIAVVSIGSPWWGETTLALVEVIFRTDLCGKSSLQNFRCAMSGIESFARDMDARGVCIDTAAQPKVKAYERLLRSAGYVKAGDQFFKGTK